MVLGSCPTGLVEAYDLAMLDLDGVVYVGGEAVPGAPGHLEQARDRGLRLAFITNNASRTPATVAEHLTSLGVAAGADDVVTSAQAAARVLADRLPAGAPVVLLGAAGLEEAVRSAGLTPVGVEDEAEALVTGYGPDVLWRDIMRAAVRVRDGLWWVASNTDLSIPTPYGTAPGHGVLVETVQRFTGVTPVVAGKPQRPLLDETVRRVGGARPLMVGDRLDTDIAGAHEAGIDSLLVLTGVTGLPELVAARPEERPTYLAPDLAGLLDPHPEVVVEDGTGQGSAGGSAEVGGWSARVESGTVQVDGSGAVADWWRVVAAVSWRHLDATGEPVDGAGLRAPDADTGR
ncbi:HAD-IIA family hydrolase [Nocardioides sp. SOB77]|uniref:HAD-IIA family hydrolase n=1 Tax=Nocardioides oceani TaxID=3058369 RepID=A0ABT8FMN9_9ACTN|nr:HAD-IIA family hydrolase [Nocardioides oceani]MDN4175781.1 HAD-IIA family hydrolase [Nocardioides oceani]